MTLAPLPMPPTLGKYRLTGVLGEGAMGIVYLGFDPDIQRQVAIKSLRTGLRGGETGDGVSASERFRNEARAAGRLQHPGIVSVYDYGHDAGLDFIAMEFVQGQPLSRYLTQIAGTALRLSEDDVHALLGQLLEALGHAHEQGVCHRDIKPSNLLVTQAGALKVSDFGVARVDAGAATRVGSLVGTPMYMAPEQFLGQPLDHRIDLYAAGVVLYQLLCGQPPFTGATESLMYRAVHESPVLPSLFPGRAHLAPWDGVLARALAKRPEDRYQTAGAFRDALTALRGRRHNPTVSTAAAAALAPAGALTPGGAPLPTPAARTGSSNLPSHFDPELLARAEAVLLPYLGPMARVLVRRTAHESPTLPTLMLRLAAQVEDPRGRDAVARQLSALLTAAGTPLRVPGTGTSSRSPHSTFSGARPGGSAAGGPASVLPSGWGPTPPTRSPGTGTQPPVAGVASTQMLTGAQQILARYLGPIAAVVVRRAAAASRSRAELVQRLAGAVDDPAQRASVAEALRQLPD